MTIIETIFMVMITALWIRKAFTEKTKCPNCKHAFVSDEEIFVSGICETMSLITNIDKVDR